MFYISIKWGISIFKIAIRIKPIIPNLCFYLSGWGFFRRYLQTLDDTPQLLALDFRPLTVTPYPLILQLDGAKAELLVQCCLSANPACLKMAQGWVPAAMAQWWWGAAGLVVQQWLGAAGLVV